MKIIVILSDDDKNRANIEHLDWREIDELEDKIAEQLQAEADDLLMEIVEEMSDE